MKGKIYTKQGKKVVRWTNGTKLLTGQPYEWEAKVINSPINTKEGEEIEFKIREMTENYEEVSNYVVKKFKQVSDFDLEFLMIKSFLANLV